MAPGVRVRRVTGRGLRGRGGVDQERGWSGAGTPGSSSPDLCGPPPNVVGGGLPGTQTWRHSPGGRRPRETTRVTRDALQPEPPAETPTSSHCRCHPGLDPDPVSVALGPRDTGCRTVPGRGSSRQHAGTDQSVGETRTTGAVMPQCYCRGRVRRSVKVLSGRHPGKGPDLDKEPLET